MRGLSQLVCKVKVSGGQFKRMLNPISSPVLGFLFLTHLLRIINVLLIRPLTDRVHKDSKPNQLFTFSFRLHGVTQSLELLNLGQGDVIKSVSLRELIHYGGIKLNPL